MQNNTDMTQSLVDDEGFPRNDIDVYQVRTVRHKIICKFQHLTKYFGNELTILLICAGLRNDLRQITEQIETALHSLHAQQREGLGLSDKISILEEFTQETVPFAKIGAVTEASPAAKAVNKTTFYVLHLQY